MTRIESLVRESGIDCRVEIRDRLAILIPAEHRRDSRLSAEERRQLLQIVRSEGFTHVAIELVPDVAAFPGD